jgi:hypothetical protein
MPAVPAPLPVDAAPEGATAGDHARELSEGVLEDVAEFIDQGTRVQEIPNWFVARAQARAVLHEGVDPVHPVQDRPRVCKDQWARCGVEAPERRGEPPVDQIDGIQPKPMASRKAACLGFIPRINRTAERGPSSSSITARTVSPRCIPSRISRSPYWSPYGSCFLRLIRLLVGVSELG